MMQAGTYYVGDLCYVMHGEWDEFCTITKDNTSGEFELKDGRRFATYDTEYGDGEYDGFCVDAGLIGCIRLEDLDMTDPRNHLDGGRVVTFNHQFETGCHDGVIFFGDISINTGDEEHDDYYDNNYDDEEDDE